jgi:hypothetical protein
MVTGDDGVSPSFSFLMLNTATTTVLVHSLFPYTRDIQYGTMRQPHCFRYILLLVVCQVGRSFHVGRSIVPSNPTLLPSLRMAGGNIDRQTSSRWYGNYKHASKALKDVTKAKKMKLELTANGVTKTLEKKRMESLQHVLTKAIIWKLFMDEYPNMEIELDINDPNYLPDVISLDATTQEPLFWGESGRMKVHKAVDLLQRYPNAHIVHCRWGMEIAQFAAPLEEYLQEKFDEGTLDLPSSSKGKFLFCSLPLDVWRFIDEETMTIHISKDDLPWKELKLPRAES